jgi:hypothetical protein
VSGQIASVWRERLSFDLPLFLLDNDEFTHDDRTGTRRDLVAKLAANSTTIRGSSSSIRRCHFDDLFAGRISVIAPASGRLPR